MAHLGVRDLLHHRGSRRLPRGLGHHRLSLAARAPGGVITTTGIGLVISDSTQLAEALAAAGWTGTVITATDFRARETAIDPADTAPPTVRAASEPFLMLFSSGTTSNPKAFIKTRQQYRDNVAVSSAHLEPFAGVASLAPGPVSYSLTLYAVVESLATGGSVHVADDFDPFTMGSRITDEAITRVVAVPAVVKALAEAARRTPESFHGLDLVVTGGANLPASIRSALADVLPDTRLISYYGAAEIGFIGDSRDGDGTWISIYDTIGVEVRDESGARLPDGEIGTVWIRAAACSTAMSPAPPTLSCDAPTAGPRWTRDGSKTDSSTRRTGR